MQNEELYRALYSKYAPNLTGAELDTKINYALDSDSTEFINAFYQKYTGEDPTEEQLNYIKSFTAEPGKTNGSASATPEVEPIVTELGLDVGTLGLPETSEELNVNLLAISNGVTKNHIKVKNRLAEEYFSLDNFKQSRMKVGSGLSFQGYARSEEDDLKSWFGEEKYEQYLQYKQSEVFDSKWVDDEIVKQIVGVVKQEEVEQYIGRLDIGDVKPDFKGHKDMVADARKAVQEGIFNIFDPEDASVTGDGQNWLQQYIDALAIDKAKETKQKELGKTSVFFGDRATDEEIMKLRVQDSAAEKVLANYFNHKFNGYKKKSKDWNTKYNDYIKVNKTYEPQFNRISTSLNALGKVDEYSSKEKIEQYNNLVAEGNNLSAEYKKALSDQNLNFEDITSEAASLQSGFDKIVDNFDKVSEVTTIAKALALDYGWLNATSLSFESGMAEMGAWVSSALKGFAYAADKVEGVGSAFADPTKLKQIMVNPQDFLSEDQNTAHMDRWRGLNASVISYNESVQNYKQASLPLDIDWDDVGWDNIGQWSSQALSNNAFSISTALAYGGAIRAGMNVPKATKILSGTFFGLEGGAKYTHMEIDQKNAGKYIAGLQESLKSATTKGERVQILDQIDYYEKALNATEMEKAFSSIAYGGIAMYAERLGTMRTLRNLNRISPTNNRLTIANTMKSTWQVGKGVVVEYAEEFLTQVGHNLVDMTVLDQNKSLLDGIDNNFNANIIFSTLAIQGPSVSMNVFNTLRGEVITQGEILANRKRTNQIIEINGALQADQESGFKLLDAGTREFMESENRKLMREAGMKDAEMFANVANMTAAEVKEMFAINQKKRDKLKQIQNLGASSAYEKAGSNYIEKQKEKLVNDIKNLNGQRDQLRGKPGARRKQIIEATLKNDKIQVETEFYLGKAYAAKNIVKGLGNVKEFKGEYVKNPKTGEYEMDLTDLEKYLDKKVKKGNITEDQKKEYLKGFRQGHNASFVGNDVILVEGNIIRNINSAETALEKSIHAYSVIHELQHINDVNTGLVQDLDVVESSKVAVKGIQNEVETLYKQGKIKEKDYTTFLERVNGYTRDNGGTVDLMELLTIAGELKNAGVLSENSTDPLLSLKLMINQFSNKYFKKGEMFFKLNNTQDVLGYIDSFQRSTRNQTLVLGPEEEVKKPKFSKMTAAQKAKVEAKVDKLGQIDTDGNNLQEKGTGNFYYQAEADKVIKELRKKRTDGELGLKNEGYLDNLIASKYKVRPVPEAFVSDVFNQLLADIRGFKPEENKSLFGYLGPRIKFRAGDIYKKIYEKKGPKKTVSVDERTKEGEVRIQLEADIDSAMEALETEDMSPAAQAKKKADKAKGKQVKESKFRNDVGFKTGSKIYNEILDVAKKTLIRAYGKTLNIKDVAARERAVVAEIQKEHNSLTSPLFKQIKNWLSYGLPQEVVPRGTKDIYFQNLKEFREEITKLVSTADLVQVERMISEIDRIFTVYKETLTRKGDVEKAVDNLELPPDAIRKYDKDKKVSVYDKVIPSETQIVAFANQPAKIPAKDKSGNIMRNDQGDILMVRSGLKGTRKDGITKNIVNGLVLDAVMEARQSKEVQDKLKQLDVDATSVQELSAATGRPVNLKFSKNIAKGDISAFAQETIKNKKNVYFNFGKEDRQRRKAVTSLGEILKATKGDPVLTAIFTHMKDRVSEGLTFGDIINSTYNEHVKGMFEGVESNMYAAFFDGNLSKKHLANILGLAKKITEAQINDIAFNDAIADIQKNNSDENIQKFLRLYSKQIRTTKFKYKGKTITKNEHVLDIINDIKPKNKFGLKKVKDGKRITFDGKEQFTFQNSTETKEVFKNNNTEEVNKALETNAKESKEAIDSTIEVIKSDKTTETKKAIVKSFFADTDAIGRKIAKFGVMATNYKGKTVLDHRVPVNQVVKEIFNVIDNPTSKNITDLQSFLENTRINNIPENVDKKLVELGKKTKGGMEVMENSEVQSLMEGVETTNYNSVPFSKVINGKKLNKAIAFSRSTNNPAKGITVLDFDDTLATSKSLIRFTRPDGTKGTLNAEQYASTYEELSDLGYKFDFSEFSKVVKGKTAPLFNKAMKLQNKFGSKNMFVLTARPADSAPAIFEFLKANGLNIPLKNITGLANSTSEAKALWMAEKVGEGYNDFYFADDALQNVQAVQNMLDQFDVKSKVQQARVKFSKNMDTEFNNILENITGIESKKRFSIIKGRKRGESKGKFRFFIPPSHEDFVGLLYNFMGKGKEGNAHRDFFEQALVRPLNRGYREIDTAKQAIANDHKSLNKQFPEVKDKLVKNTPDGDFTFQDAIRVYLWDKHGHKIPGLTETDQKKLAELVMSDSQLQAYAETLNIISKQENYVAPGQAWETANIRIDLVDATGRVGRADYFSEFNENAEVIFSEENLNKIEAAYGRSAREAIEDMLHRIKTGVNRPKGTNGKPNMFMNWLNASVSGVMFFNTRSALLQQLSNVNFLNFADNNIFKAGLAFANQPQYWKDFAMIFNSDMLKQRRGGLGTDINGAELADAIKKARPDNMFDQVSIVVGKALKLGFLPTQIGDNIAIATGGAAFYRNRVNKYVKDGLSVKEAETKAFTDLQNITQSTQQSARPDMTSQQQASWIGKLVLNFLNTPSQYNRIIKKAGLDIKNRRITPPNTTQLQSDMSNMSRILYYGAAQNLIFYSLQTALFAVMFDGDDEESEAFLKKKERVINGSIDTILRGSGIYGVGISTLKNMMIKFLEQREKGYNKDESAVIMEMLNFSPVVGIKARKVVNAEKTLNYNKDIISEMETFDIDNPQWSAVTNYVESITTAPVNRIYQKTINLRNAADNQYTAFQRALFFSGYTTWSLDLGDTKKMENIKSEVKDKKKKQRKKKKKKKLIY